jgi:hypothetical protein
MSELRLETWTMPAANLGQNNPFPALHPSFDIDLPTEFPNVPAEMQQNMALGRLPHYLPYTMQDDYNRERKVHDFRVAVLENDVLPATFLLELGGRLWSLFHKPDHHLGHPQKPSSQLQTGFGIFPSTADTISSLLGNIAT